MGNPWAPPDQSQPRDQSPPPAPGAPGGATPPPGTGGAWHPGHVAPPQQPGSQSPYPGAPGPHPQHGGPQHGSPQHPGQHAGPPAGPHPGQRPPTPPDPAGVARATRAAVWSACLLLAGVVLLSAPYPGLLVAPVTAVASLAFAIVAVTRAARARARGPVVALSVVLVVASLMWTFLSAQSLLYLDAVRDLQRCSGAALTQQAQSACQSQFDRDVRERIGSVFGLGG
ncbi:hypothetical protein [Cellulomonas iranensis]|uniref:DUF4190 domain-containing protein n=1 Tax=Cellulomonas iranensis TaxID=76862 RepID=A0ABU0GMQ6_9CELL|nr:hypothetical protein [Cellulomonas iranensis]MDQ0426338.1 hypothetical protein [Cellulomonas iranensis]